jgi:hypothetical protein
MKQNGAALASQLLGTIVLDVRGGEHDTVRQPQPRA